MSLRPTPDPSTAGARWLFAQKEYLRRVGDSPRTRRRFNKLTEWLDRADDAEIKHRLGKLKAARAVRGTVPPLIVAEQLLLEGELGKRRGNGRGRPIEAVYRDILVGAAFPRFVQAVGEKKSRRILAQAAEAKADNFKAGTDTDAMIDDVIAFALAWAEGAL